MTVRSPAVAGSFYPGSAVELNAEVAALFAGAPARGGEAVAVMCPHAGWFYSGALAAKTLARVRVPETVVILCPNHTGRGARVAVFAEGSWRLPDGEVAVDATLAAAILDQARSIRGCRADQEAHRDEHAIEVLLPLLRARQPALRVVPIVVAGLDVAECIALGQAIARAAVGDVLVVASSDLSHYLPEDEARRRDRFAVDAVLAGDPVGLVDAVARHDVSMCGVGPAAVMLSYARGRAAAAQLVGYTTSAEASGDTRRVVGYAGVILPRRDTDARLHR